eukprot:1632380-Pleurochrysis_carterae.AAC.5
MIPQGATYKLRLPPEAVPRQGKDAAGRKIWIGSVNRELACDHPPRSCHPTRAWATASTVAVLAWRAGLRLSFVVNVEALGNGKQAQVRVLVGQIWQLLCRSLFMTHIQPQVALGHTAPSSRSGTSTARPKANRLLCVRTSHQRGTGHGRKMKAVAMAATNRVPHTTDCLGRMQSRYEEREGVQLDRILALQPVAAIDSISG